MPVNFNANANAPAVVKARLKQLEQMAADSGFNNNESWGSQDGFLNQLRAETLNTDAAKNALKIKLATSDMDINDDNVVNVFDNYNDAVTGAAKDKVDIGGTQFGGNMAMLFNALKANAKAKPAKALGMTALGAGNVAGLFDNDKFLGQAAGLAGGALLPSLMDSGISPSTRIMWSLAGGTLGSLFDNLRAKRQRQKAQTRRY